MAIIPSGVEGMAVSSQLINTVREEVRNKKNNLTTPEAVHMLALSKLPEGGLHHTLLKELRAALESEFEQASAGECIEGVDLSGEVIELLRKRLPPNIQVGNFELRVQEQLRGLPSRYNSRNREVSQQVSERSLLLPPHAQLRSSSSGGVREAESGSLMLMRLARDRDRRKEALQSYMQDMDSILHGLGITVDSKRAELLAAEVALRDAEARLADHGPGAGAEASSSTDTTRQQLQQAVTTAKQVRDKAAAELKTAETTLKQRTAETDDEISKKASSLARLTKDLEDLRKSEAGAVGGPVKLEDIVYVGDDGAEQAIFLPVLKELIIFRCIISVPTPNQIEKIMREPKQGQALFPLEPVGPSEDIQQFALRVKNYVLSAQLVGASLDGCHVLLFGLREREVRDRLETALSVMTGPYNLDDMARKAIDVQSKLQSMQLMARMRSIYGGKGALVAGSDGDGSTGASGETTADEAPSKLEQQIAVLTATLEKCTSAMSAGFKQAGKFAGGGSGGSSGGGGDTKGQAAATGQKAEQREQRPKCPKCERRHTGECWGRHEACGRFHHPDKECYGADYKGRKRRGGGQAEGQNGSTAAAAAGVAPARAPTDAELAAQAGEGMGVWNVGGACQVAALGAGRVVASAECLDDGLAGGAMLAGGKLRQDPPASFHQQRAGVMTRRAAKQAEMPPVLEEPAAGSSGAAAAEEGAAPKELSSSADEPRADLFQELRRVVPSSTHVLLALDAKADSAMLEDLLGAGADSALAVVRMPSLTFRELLERGKLGMLPAATVAASHAALSAALAKSSGKSVAEEAVLPEVKSSSGGCAASFSKLCPMLPYLKPQAYKLFDVLGDRSVHVRRLLVDTGANGALISLEVVRKAGLRWKPLEGAEIATADGGAACPEGLLEGVKLLMLPGTPNATAVPFDALVMDTGGAGVYDAILGREQMHMLGMVMDFGRQRCYIRSKLKQDCWDLVEVPWMCVKGKEPGVGVSCAASGPAVWEAAVAATVKVPLLQDWAGAQEARLMLAGDVERNPGPGCTRWTPAEVTALEGRITELTESGVLQPAHTAQLWPSWCWHSTWSLKLDMRWFNAVVASVVVADPVVDKAWRNSWKGEQQARLMAAGDVEPNPGPLYTAHVGYPGKGPCFAALMCVLAACLAGVFAVGYALAGWLGSAVAAAAVGWLAAVVCCPKLVSWATLRLEVARAPRARRPKKRLSWQLRRALASLPARCVRQKQFKLGVTGLLFLLALVLCCGTATATAGAVEQGIQWNRAAMGVTGFECVRWAAPGDLHPQTVELLAGELTGAFTASYGSGITHPAELLEALEPAGERDKPDCAPDVTVDPEGKWQFAAHPDATEEEKAALQEAVKSRKHAFAYSHAEMPGYEHKVGWKLKHNDPIKEPCHSRRFSPAEKGILDEKCAELEKAGLIKEIPSTNPYACHPVLAAKKDGVTGEWTQKRLCQDYRKLNKAMVADSYTPPLPEDIFAAAAGCKVWSVIDMRAGFHQLVLDDATARTTAFWWGRRLMQYNRLSFGTRNATAIYQRVMDEVLRAGGCSGFAIAYVDDLVIFSPDMKTHTEHVKKVLDCLHKVGLRAHPEKSIFGASQVEYLGHMVSADGLSPTKAKVAAILALPSPRNLSELRCIMGILNYYRLYIPGFSQIAAPIYQLTGKDAKWEWTTEREAAYQQLKQLLATPNLALRPPNPTKEFVLHTDWSVNGVGAVQGQRDGDEEYMVACASRSLNEHEKRYTPWKGELLAAVWGMKTFRHYLAGHPKPFRLVVDHRPLLGLLTTAEPNCQQVRWLMAVQDHDFVVEHRAGVKHTNADALSRFPDSSTLDTAGARMDRGPLPAPALPDVIMPDGRRLTGEQAVQEMGDSWQEQMLREQPAAGVAAAIVINEAQLEVCGPPVPGWMDEFAPSSYELAGLTAATPNLTDIPTWHQHQEQVLQAQASEWVLAAQQRAGSRNLTAGGGVDTSCCASTFFSVARRQGITLFEPFGGLGAGLEMVLRHGVKVNRYVYADTAEAAQKVMRHRLAVLTGRYPHLLPASAWDLAFDTLPMDVYGITKANLSAAVQPGEQWLVVAGWECQDLSPAGGGKGLSGSKSKSYFQLLHLLNDLQGVSRAKGNPPIGYVLENTAFQYHWNAEVAGRDFARVTDVLGNPLEVDAARFGSRAHRLRNFWTNLGDPVKVAAAITCAERPPGLTV
jgi:hypothetical protein